ncbi:hypothetical protein HCN44_004393 [Aphidius gifuensis]|uniref:tRNA (adenine(58)-N(1))-methyltransferase non-catalytic subunit TRM6 n=1 Tax=Aphidius gifuensis TaxID=684658 RepID=A0A834Y1M3_APHGI|nr:tRNA (adenine(58)-N(1))-methyltransferase non-catalytic subunit TRM6 [Aphidius gifuensis]KAF7994921.1 hypothetical protein HCN44_004393 [Aphidius gifuensis]
MGVEEQENLVKLGSYVVVQKQNFRKLVKITDKPTFTLGKEFIEMEQLPGKPYWTTFKMVSSKNGKRNVALEVAEKADTMEELCRGIISGTDNRTITDDSTSQKLSREEIEVLRDAGKSSIEIVGSLIENSSSFAAKTEFSQAKYIKKKEKKYYRFLMIHKPTLSIVQDIYFKQDCNKINSLRMDTLSQILSYSDVKADGNYLLYDSGSCGLTAAALLSRIGAKTTGNLVHLHPGNQAQMTLVNALNFPDEQLKRMSTVNLYTFLRLNYQGESEIIRELVKKHIIWKQLKESEKNNGDNEDIPNAKRRKLNDEDDDDNDDNDNNDIVVDNGDNIIDDIIDDNIDVPDTFKEPKWLNETRQAVDCFKNTKADGLTIIAKEHPSNIIQALLEFLGTSRPFVIYHCYREPLQETYIMLKQRRDIVNLKLLTNFCRNYQVLPNRTHPEIMMNDLGGYLLTGYLVD